MSGQYPTPGQNPDPSDPYATGPGRAGGPPPPSPVLTSEERGWGVAAHLSGFAGVWIVGLAFLGPLVVWLVGRERHPFVDHHSKEALNFQLTFFLIGVVGTVLAFIGTLATLGFGLFIIVPLGIALGLAWVVIPIIAAVKAWDGEGYRYPLTIRFVS